MQISICFPGKCCAIDVESSDTVESLKSKIRDTEGVPPVDQCLMFLGIRLQDGKTLADYNIKNNSIVHLHLPLRSCKIFSTYTPEKITASIIQENKTVDTINWNLMVVIEAKSQIESWEKVGAAMSKKFKFAGDFHLQPVSSTRALFCIENTIEREYLFKQEPWFFEYIQFKFVPWSSGMNLLSPAEIVEISARWILVRGVPFCLWNSETFEMIGAKCGGLLEVSHFSKFGLNLSAIKLRVKGPLPSDAFTIQVNHKDMQFTASVSVAADQSERMESTIGRIKVSVEKSCPEVGDTNSRKKARF